MPVYMEFLKVKHGYRSLKAKYFDQFPTLGGAGYFGISEMLEKPDEEDIMQFNPIEEKDRQISKLKRALEENQKETTDINVMKETLLKTRNELMCARRSRRRTCLSLFHLS